MQQNYARVSGILERDISDLVDDALQLNTAGLSRHGVRSCAICPCPWPRLTNIKSCKSSSI